MSHSGFADLIGGLGKLLHGDHAKAKPELVKVLGNLEVEGKDLMSQGASALLRVAVIGFQSAGKSSVIEALTGRDLPKGSGRTDRFPIEVYASASKPFPSLGELVVVDGEKSVLPIASEAKWQEFLDLFVDARWTELARIERVRINYDSPAAFRNVVFVSTPGLLDAKPKTPDEVRAQKIVDAEVDRADLVYWLFDINEAVPEYLDGNLRKLLVHRNRVVRVVVAQVDRAARTFDEQESLARTFVGKLRTTFGENLIDAEKWIMFAAPAVRGGGEGAQGYLDSFTNSIHAEDAETALRTREAALERRRRTYLTKVSLVLEKELANSPVAPNALIDLRGQAIEVVRSEKADTVAQTSSGVRAPIEAATDILKEVLKGVIADRVTFWGTMWRGAAGQIKSKWGMQAAIMRDIEKLLMSRSGEVEKHFDRASQFLEKELLRPAFDEIERRIGEEVKLSEPKVKRPTGIGAPTVGNNFNLAEFITESFFKVLRQVFTKEIVETIVMKVQQEILAASSKAAGQALVHKLETAFVSVSARSALSQALSKTLSVWLLATLPLDLANLYATIKNEREKLIESLDDLMKEKAQTIVEDFAFAVREVFWQAEDQIRIACEDIVEKQRVRFSTFETFRLTAEPLVEQINDAIGAQQSTKTA